MLAIRTPSKGELSAEFRTPPYSTTNVADCDRDNGVLKSTRSVCSSSLRKNRSKLVSGGLIGTGAADLTGGFLGA